MRRSNFFDRFVSSDAFYVAIVSSGLIVFLAWSCGHG